MKKRPIELGSPEEYLSWSLHKLLRGHSGDIYDLSWSPDNQYIVSASVDNSIIIWNIEKGKGVISIKDHQHFVQGVSWDPLNEYIITQSADKSVNVYNLIRASNDKVDLKIRNIAKIKSYVWTKSVSSVDEKDGELNNTEKINVNYFANENQHPGFFRRLSWSPDGEFFLAVSGLFQDLNESKSDNVVWGFMRKDLSSPLFMLPTLSPATCVRFCPIVFKRTSSQDSGCLIKLDYKLVFAIGTKESVLIYDTESTSPRYIITNIHVMQITDLTWKGKTTLSASSSDGYVSFFHFNKVDLGEQADLETLPEKAKILYEQYVNVNYESNIMKNEIASISIIRKVEKPKKQETMIIDDIKEDETKQNKIEENIQNTNEKQRRRVTPTLIN